MNQRGETISLSLLLVLALSSLLILMSLELKRDLELFKQRGKLFLCAKETKGELSQFLTFMGKSNWAINNLDRVSLITLFIPGLQGVSANSEKAKQAIQAYQNIKLISYMKNLTRLKTKSCPVGPELFKTPFQISLKGFKRNRNGAAQLRQTEIHYILLRTPYALELHANLEDLEKPHPHVLITSREKKVTPLFPLSQLLQ